MSNALGGAVCQILNNMHTVITISQHIASWPSGLRRPARNLLAWVRVPIPKNYAHGPCDGKLIARDFGDVSQT